MNWKHLRIITSLLGNSWEQLCFVKRISSSSSEWQLSLSGNLALEKLPAPHFPLLPSFLALWTHPKHPGRSWSVWKGWQHRVGPSVYFCSIALLVLSAVLQISDETGSCFCRLLWLQSLWRCCLLCPISAVPAGLDGSQRGFSSTTPTAPTGMAVIVLCVAVIERPLTGSGDFLCVLLCFWSPFTLMDLVNSC